MKRVDETEHKQLANWAADCAEHVLQIFENSNPNDLRPRKAIEATHIWVNEGMEITEVRKIALAAHAAARETTNLQARAAARSAGHALATAHVAKHAKYSASYAQKASFDPIQEREWQLNRLPENLRFITKD